MHIPSDLAINGMLYIGSGAFAGLMAGLLGIGGGLVIVPALVFIFMRSPEIPNTLVMHMAAGSSLACMIFTSMSSIIAHRQRSGLVWPIYIRMAPGIIVGIILGAMLADALPTNILKIIFGVFLLLIVFKMYYPTKLKVRRRFPSKWKNRAICSVIGLKSGLLGIGGGAVIIPYLTYCGVKVRKIAGISSMCSLTIAIVGCIVYSLTGLNEANLPAYGVGYVYWPAVLLVAIPSLLFAQIGASLTYSLPLIQLKRGFIFFLLITALHLLL